ncbi:FecR family protein [Flavitalea flava]
MKVTAPLIEKFFRGECDREQQEAVKEYFSQNPEVLREHLTMQSWEDFHADDHLASPLSEKMLRVIAGNTYKKARIRKIGYRVASAAAVLILCVAGYWWIAGESRKEMTGKGIAAASKEAPKKDQPEWKERSNHTGKLMRFSLQDGTVVELADKSGITYPEPFAGDKRVIQLKGQALFKVADDKNKPFTVYAGGLYTTALGTVFKITAWENQGSSNTRVYLLSGRCVVRPDSNLQKNGVKEIYLQPGQAMLLENLHYTVSIDRVRPTNTPDGQKAAALAVKKILTFNNESLVNILNTIGSTYHLRFEYKEGLLDNMNFTGVFDAHKESLESFLNTLGTLNSLNLKQNNKVITITQ